MSSAALTRRIAPQGLMRRSRRAAAHISCRRSAGSVALLSPDHAITDSARRQLQQRRHTPTLLHASSPDHLIARRHKSSMLHKPKPKQSNSRQQGSSSVVDGNGSSKQKPPSDATARLAHLLARLHKVDTAALCDADKTLLARRQNGADGFAHQDHPYVGLGLMGTSIRPRNYFPEHSVGAVGGGNMGDADGLKMIGPARTVQCTRPNDFLAVLRGLDEAKTGEVLVVNTLDSTRAVAGGLFLGEAARKSLGGIVVDGCVRDVAQIAKHGIGIGGCLMYSSGVTPYAGTVQSVGETQVTVICGGVKVSPGDVVMGDGDGVLVGSLDTFEQVIDVAENIVEAERTVLRGIGQGVSLHSMMNYREHYELRESGKESAMDFRKTRLVSFEGVKPIDYE